MIFFFFFGVGEGLVLMQNICLQTEPSYFSHVFYSLYLEKPITCYGPAKVVHTCAISQLNLDSKKDVCQKKKKLLKVIFLVDVEG